MILIRNFLILNKMKTWSNSFSFILFLCMIFIFPLKSYSQIVRSEDIYVQLPRVDIRDSSFIHILDSIILTKKIHTKEMNNFAYTIGTTLINKDSCNLTIALDPPEVWDIPNTYYFEIKGVLFVILKENLIKNLFIKTKKKKEFHYIKNYVKIGDEFVLPLTWYDPPIWILSYSKGGFNLISKHKVPD